MTADGPMPQAPVPGRIVDPRGRAKAYRPLPPPEREAALARGLDAYGRGAFYLAHEELEPAWMAADDPAERELLAGLIKLAAAGVHAARGNPAGMATNLRGSRERLARAQAAGVDAGLDLPALLNGVDACLADVATTTPPSPAETGRLTSPPSHDVAGPPARSWRPPLGLQPPAIHMRSRA
jgi:hypothetical protein